MSLDGCGRNRMAGHNAVCAYSAVRARVYHASAGMAINGSELALRRTFDCTFPSATNNSIHKAPKGMEAAARTANPNHQRRSRAKSSAIGNIDGFRASNNAGRYRHANRARQDHRDEPFAGSDPQGEEHRYRPERDEQRPPESVQRRDRHGERRRVNPWRVKGPDLAVQVGQIRVPVERCVHRTKGGDGSSGADDQAHCQRNDEPCEIRPRLRPSGPQPPDRDTAPTIGS